MFKTVSSAIMLKHLELIIQKPITITDGIPKRAFCNLPDFHF